MKIRNDSDLKDAMRRLDEIWSASPDDADWGERCALVDLIEQYENSSVEIPAPSPEDAILFRMEQERNATMKEVFKWGKRQK